MSPPGRPSEGVMGDAAQPLFDIDMAVAPRPVNPLFSPPR